MVVMLKPSTDGLFARLDRTRKSLFEGLSRSFGGARSPDDADFDDLEERLILSDVGAAASARVVDALRRSARARDAADAREVVRRELTAILKRVEFDHERLRRASPLVILMVGVNGVGKTTTAAKLAHRFQRAGREVMLAACDTFRAAAIEQLRGWGERLGVPVVAQRHGADAAAVAHDALHSAIARRCGVLIVDSAGRQHVNRDLMEQLGKIARVLKRIDPDAPHEVWLTVDAGNGQNVLSQIEHFAREIRVTGVCVTKLDGTAKGGVMIAMAQRHAVPIPFIGLGERVHDLRPFEAAAFADALLADDPVPQ